MEKDFLIGFTDHLEFERRVSKGTIKIYTSIIARLQNFLSKPLNEVTREDIKEFIKYVMSMGLNNSTTSNYIIALRSFYNYLFDTTQNQSILTISFYLNKIMKVKRDRSVRPVPTDQEWQKIRETIHAFLKAYSFNKKSKHYKETLRDCALFETFNSTGARSAELVDMRVEDVEFDNETILIKSGKGGHQRFVLFNKRTKNILQSYIQENNLSSQDKLFSIDRRHQLNYIVKKWAIRANINPKIHPHSFRHRHITVMQRKGVNPRDVANQAGHSNLETTRLYTHLDIEHRRQIYNQHGFQNI